MNARREFLISLGALAWSLPARAQLPRTMYRIGFLGNSTTALEANLIESFRQGLRDLGYEEGRNITIEYRWAEGKYERLPALIAELVALNLDVMVTAGTPATLAVKKAAISVPLVIAAIGDPVGVGVVPSLARPAGNITGLSAMATDLQGKRLQLLGEVVTGLSHVAVMWNPLNAFQEISIREWNAAGETLKIKVQPVAVGVAEDLDAAFATLVKDKAAGAYHPGGPRLSAQPRSADGLRHAKPVAGSIRIPGIGRGGRIDVLRAKLRGFAQACRYLRRQDPEGCETGRPAY